MMRTVVRWGGGDALAVAMHVGRSMRDRRRHCYHAYGNQETCKSPCSSKDAIMPIHALFLLKSRPHVNLSAAGSSGVVLNRHADAALRLRLHASRQDQRQQRVCLHLTMHHAADCRPGESQKGSTLLPVDRTSMLQMQHEISAGRLKNPGLQMSLACPVARPFIRIMSAPTSVAIPAASARRSASEATMRRITAPHWLRKCATLCARQSPTAGPHRMRIRPPRPIAAASSP